MHPSLLARCSGTHWSTTCDPDEMVSMFVNKDPRHATHESGIHDLARFCKHDCIHFAKEAGDAAEHIFGGAMLAPPDQDSWRWKDWGSIGIDEQLGRTE